MFRWYSVASSVAVCETLGAYFFRFCRKCVRRCVRGTIHSPEFFVSCLRVVVVFSRLALEVNRNDPAYNVLSVCSCIWYARCSMPCSQLTQVLEGRRRFFLRTEYTLLYPQKSTGGRARQSTRGFPTYRGLRFRHVNQDALS